MGDRPQHPFVTAVERALRAQADPERAVPMAHYMRDQFPFLGIGTPARRSIVRAALREHPVVPDELVAVTGALWDAEEREFQYAACDVLDGRSKQCGPEFVEHLATLITTKSWWDTVDSIAPRVGELVRAHPELLATMDEWIDADNVWLRRVAILHQLRYKQATDAERLFGYCARRASDVDFFIRKAIGWSLREFAKTDRPAVEAFVATHAATLSPLSKREALRVR